MKNLFICFLFFLYITKSNAQWIQKNAFFEGSFKNLIEFNDNIYAIGETGVFVSENNCLTWKEINNGLGYQGEFSKYPLVPNNENYNFLRKSDSVLYLFAKDFGVYKLDFKKSRWEFVNGTLRAQDFEIVNQELYMISYHDFSNYLFKWSETEKIFQPIIYINKKGRVELFQIQDQLFITCPEKIMYTQKGLVFNYIPFNGLFYDEFIEFQLIGFSESELFGYTNYGLIAKFNGSKWIRFELEEGFTEGSISLLQSGSDLICSDQKQVFFTNPTLVGEWQKASFIPNCNLNDFLKIKNYGVLVATSQGLKKIKDLKDSSFENLNNSPLNFGVQKMESNSYSSIFLEKHNNIFLSFDSWESAVQIFKDNELEVLNNRIFKFKNHFYFEGYFNSENRLYKSLNGLDWEEIPDNIQDMKVIGDNGKRKFFHDAFHERKTYYSEESSLDLKPLKLPDSLLISSQIIGDSSQTLLLGNIWSNGNFVDTLYFTKDLGENWYIGTQGLPTALQNSKIFNPDTNFFLFTNIYDKQEEKYNFQCHLWKNNKWNYQSTIISKYTDISDLVKFGNFYYLSCNYGIYFSENEGKSWEQIKDGLFDNIVPTGLHKQNNKLFLLTGGNGIFTIDLISSIPKFKPLYSQIEVFPNPADKKINIRFPSNFRQGFINWSTVDGRIIRTEKINMPLEETQSFDVSNFPEGILFFQIFGGSDMYSGKVFIKH